MASHVLCWLLAVLICTIHAEDGIDSSPDEVSNEIPGHMQPLGSHMEPRLVVKRIQHIPTPQEFNDEYVRNSQPVIFEGLMREQEVIKNWQNDDYLRY